VNVGAALLGAVVALFALAVTFLAAIAVWALIEDRRGPHYPHRRDR